MQFGNVVQSVETQDLKSCQCGFDSRHSYFVVMVAQCHSLVRICIKKLLGEVLLSYPL